MPTKLTAYLPSCLMVTANKASQLSTWNLVLCYI